MAIPNDVHRFLQAVFGSDHGTQAIFANLNPPAHMRDFRQLDPKRDCYWSIAAYPPGYEGTNTEDAALEVRALVIDDVGTKGPSEGAVLLALGEPTAITRTSTGNYQWAYRLLKPVAKDDWAGFFGGIEALIGHSKPLEARAAQTLMRLPMGINTKGPDANGKMKLDHGGTFKVELVKINPGVVLNPDTIARVAGRSTGAKTSSGGGWAYDIAGLMALIPNNDVHYDDWFAHAERTMAAAIDKDAARPAFEMWSKKSVKHDPDEIELRWPTVDPTRTSGKELLDEAEAADPEGYKAWHIRESRLAFDDGVIHPEAPKRKGITATPFKWMDLSKTEPRDWLYGDILLRKFISMTVAPGGTGKSSLVAVETLAQITGRNLLGEDLPSGELRVWLWNLEDTYGETQKKILAAAKHYGISEVDIGDRLYVDSGRDQQLVIAEMIGSNPVPRRPVIAALVEQIRLRKIDVIVIDPFVSCHWVPENDNGAMDMVVKEWGQVAELGNCAVHLVDHTSKAGSKEVVTDSSRGAKAKTDAARVVRVVNRMTDTDGKTYGIVDTWRYFNTFNDKANMAPPKARRDWFKMESLWANNGGGAARAFSVGAASNTLGDSMGVTVQWTPPSAKAMAGGDAYTKVIAVMGAKRWRVSPHSPDWIGNAVAQGCGLLPHSTADRLSVKQLITTWISEGLFKVVRQLDEKRNMREYIEIAQVY